VTGGLNTRFAGGGTERRSGLTSVFIFFSIGKKGQFWKPPIGAENCTVLRCISYQYANNPSKKFQGDDW